MDLANVIDRCRSYEARAAALYRTFAARTRAQPGACALWTSMARDEEEHARTLERAGRMLSPDAPWHARLDGWEESLEEIEARLRQAEDPRIGGNVDRQLAAALALERTEIDALYRRLTRLTMGAVRSEDEHLEPLLALAETRSDPAVQMQAAMLRARILLANDGRHVRGTAA
jgi:rubrerythrin